MRLGFGFLLNFITFFIEKFTLCSAFVFGLVAFHGLNAFVSTVRNVR